MEYVPEKEAELDVWFWSLLLYLSLVLGSDSFLFKRGTIQASQIRVRNRKLLFIQNICYEYRWDGSFEHQKHMFKLMGRKITAILRLKIA